ncbi:MAG: PAS domain S-box protein, partial [Candidatus Cyclobacteriaceae bacterium M3_2C_046]
MNSKRNIPSGLMVLKKIMEGTSADTGTSFFESLVKTLAEILDVSGVWVTEFLKESNRLRALAFWSNGQFIKEYEYDVPGTPCEPVLQSPDEVCHIPRNVIKLFPRDPDLRPVNAVSYMGLALKDKTNSIIGHLALLDDKPMEELPEIFPIFKIFASRASAELQRLYSEKIILESEAKIQRLLNGSGEAILECDRSGKIIQANNSAINLLGIDCEKLGQLELAKYFDQISLQAINQYTQDSTASVSSVLLEEIKGLKPDGSIFPADVVLSKYTYKHQPFFALFIRNLEEKKQQENELKHLNLQTIILQEKVKANNCDKIIGSSPVLFKAIELVNQVAATDTTTIIYGETGTGKELFAQAI